MGICQGWLSQSDFIHDGSFGLFRVVGYLLLIECERLSVRGVEKVIAKHFPKAPVEDCIRQRVAPMSVDAVDVNFSASTRWAAKLQKLQELLSHKYPQGKIADITEEAFDLLIEKFEKTKSQDLTRVRPEGALAAAADFADEHGERADVLDSRTPPKTLRIAVWKRDDSQCTYVSPSGYRCEAKRFLQIDHIKPWALGGSSHDIDNLRLLCSTHNKLRARETFIDFWRDFAAVQEKWLA